MHKRHIFDRERLQPTLDALASVSMILAAIAVIGTAANLWWQMRVTGRTQQNVVEQNLPTEPQPLDGAPVFGSANAKIAVVEYSDFQCQFCGSFAHETWPELKRRYVDTGQVLFAFRHLPLPGHPFAKPAAISADCAGRQGRFWEMHDLLFDRQAELDASTGTSLGKTLKLHESTFRQCLEQPPESVERDIAAARSLQITATPTFLIGTIEPGRRVKVTHVIRGTKPANDFAQFIEDVAKAQQRAWWRRILQS